MSDYELDTVLDKDDVYRENMAATYRRQAQGKITAVEVNHIRERLVDNAMRRYRQRHRRTFNPAMA